MRIAAVIPMLCISYATGSQAAVDMEAVASCALGSKGKHTLTLLRDHPIEGTAVYYVSKDGASPARLYPGDEDQSRGEAIQVACVGLKERAFVLSGEFTSNYLQGLAIRYNTTAGQWERVDFAERERPASIYMDAKGITVLIPNNGRNESSKRYILYRYETGKGEVEQIYSDRRPQSEAVKIPSQRN
jgi:hypothetical protein